MKVLILAMALALVIPLSLITHLLTQIGGGFVHFAGILYKLQVNICQWAGVSRTISNVGKSDPTV